MFLQIMIDVYNSYYFVDQATANDICFLFLSKSTYLKSKYTCTFIFSQGMTIRGMRKVIHCNPVSPWRASS